MNAVFENVSLFPLPFQRHFSERQFVVLLTLPQSAVVCLAEKPADKLERLCLRASRPCQNCSQPLCHRHYQSGQSHNGFCPIIQITW